MRRGRIKAGREQTRGIFVLLGVPLAALACHEPPPRTRIEDQTRRVAPLPACVLPLPPRRIETAGTLRTLRETQIVKLMFPSFDEAKHALPESAPACTGASVFGASMFQGAKLARGGWPFDLQEGDVFYGSGGDRLKIAWLRSHHFDDGTVAGPLAVVRSGQRFAELFALGVYRGRPEKTQLASARMGGDFVVTAENDGCTGRKEGSPCETTLSVFRPHRGAFIAIAEIPVERVAYSGRGERGASGVLEYHLTSLPEFLPTSIRIVEQIRIKDDSGRELRKAEHQRDLIVDETGKATSHEPALWDQMVKLEEPRPPKRGG
jgi:hypothetical protein